MADVTVTVPADSRFVQVLRSVVSSVAAKQRFGFDEIDDLRLAVDEAAAHLLGAGPPASILRLSIVLAEDGLDVLTIRDVDTDAWPPEGARTTLAWRVLNALTDEARFERTEDGPAVRFAKRTVSQTVS